MLKNPYLNALSAGLYIVIIVFVIGSFVDGPDEETLLAPMAMISLLVLSVAIMAGLFFFTPVKMLLNNDSEGALKFFFRTLGTFALCVALFVFLLLVL